jgi:Subtilase family
MMRRLFAIAVTTTMLLMLAPASNAQVPPTPPRDQWYAQNDTGHWQNPATRVRIDDACLGLSTEAERMSCSLDAFQKRPFVVIALTDSGINAYQQDFRAPDFVHHPSKFIEGYPQNAKAVDLSFGVADQEGYDAARNADEEVWDDIQRSSLVWFPGTRIIGGISIAAGGTSNGYSEFPILDEGGHGTGTASVAAGQFYGSNPNALIVEVEGLGDAPLNWAASQPWIDIVSNSWGPAYAGVSVPTDSVERTKVATTRGQSILFSSGNGNLNTNSNPICVPVVGVCQSPWAPGGPLPVEDPCKCKVPNSNVSILSHNKGPSWIMTVGAASPINGQSHWWHGVPVDVSSFGSKWAAAGAFSADITNKRDFGGTSNATPVTAGVLSTVIQRAREVLGDTKAGQKPGGVVALAASGVTPPATGPLADGKLTRLEAEEIVVKTAQPVAFDPVKATWDYAIYPTTPTYYTYQGYGIVDHGSRARALSVLMGQTPMPDRAEVDTFMAQVDAARDAIYDS